jgi:hypothetical protein
MKLRRLQRIGHRRTSRRLTQDVNLGSIPILDVPFDKWGPETGYGMLGAAPKVFVVMSKTQPFREAYIAKGPYREGPLECVTEHIITSIGRMLPIRIARGRLVRFPVAHGAAADVRYMSRFFLDIPAGERLAHASALAARCLDMKEDDLHKEIPPRDRAEWQFYSVPIIESIFREVCRNLEGDEFQKLRDGLARMIAFDALVGATDRHAQNWGVVENVAGPTSPRFADIYDTARGLFWNHSDDHLREVASQNTGSRMDFIRQYADRSMSLIGGTGKEPKRPNHFDLVRHLLDERRDTYHEPIGHVVRAFRHQTCIQMIHAGYGRTISRLRLNYIADLLKYRHERLIAILSTGR